VLHLLFSTRASVVSGRMNSNLLAPYLSGLLTGDEINGALARLLCRFDL
jgi:2-dehydro-3-deoxygalactonokinase